MQWEFVVALIVAIPLILFPAAFVWYLNVGGVYQAVKKLVARRAAREAQRTAKVATVPTNGTDQERQNFWNLTYLP